ncbi:MAG: hypothetical protein KME55_41960 [Nostoc indistinguendum CM1-VF10]|jgi:hypothetical protein|nr:hypothetical protein [Nostoc indistinguendum CM1-VF10]
MDASNMIDSYHSLHHHHGLQREASIAFWWDTPIDRRSRQELELNLVWLLPMNLAKEAKSLNFQALNLSEVPTSVLPVNKRKPSVARAWKAGGVTVVMQKQSKDQVRLSILINSRIAYNAVEKKSYMQGGDPEPVKFPKFDGTPGIPFPIGAFQANAKSAPMIVFWQPSYEGQGYSVVASVKSKMQKVDENAIYFCAF